MTKIPELHPILEGWLREGPLSAHVPAYVARLKRGRYATLKGVMRKPLVIGRHFPGPARGPERAASEVKA